MTAARPHVVRVAPAALRCWPWLPGAARAGSWWQSPTGEFVQVLPNGMPEPLVQAGLPHGGRAEIP